MLAGGGAQTNTGDRIDEIASFCLLSLSLVILGLCYMSACVFIADAWSATHCAGGGVGRTQNPCFWFLNTTC